MPDELLQGESVGKVSPEVQRRGHSSSRRIEHIDVLIVARDVDRVVPERDHLEQIAIESTRTAARVGLDLRIRRHVNPAERRRGAQLIRHPCRFSVLVERHAGGNEAHGDRCGESEPGWEIDSRHARRIQLRDVGHVFERDGEPVRPTGEWGGEVDYAGGMGRGWLGRGEQAGPRRARGIIRASRPHEDEASHAQSHDAIHLTLLAVVNEQSARRYDEWGVAARRHPVCLQRQSAAACGSQTAEGETAAGGHHLWCAHDATFSLKQPSLSIGQREAERLELQRHVHGLHHDVGGDGELDRREGENRLHPGAHQPVDDVLRRLGRGDHDRDVARLVAQIHIQVANVAHAEAVPPPADLLGVLVVDRRHVEAALPKARVLDQGAADATGADEHDAIGAAQAQDVADAGDERGNGVAEAALAERPEEREVLADLGGGGAAAPRQLGRGDGGLALGIELLEKPQVEREPPDRALGDLPHCELFHNRALHRRSPTNVPGPSVPGGAADSSPSCASPSATRAAECPVAAMTTLRSCLRRRAKHAVTKTRNGASSATVTSGVASGVSRSSALSTLGRGVNAPARTGNSFATRQTACTPTESAPYVLEPGAAATRSATSAWTRKTMRSGSGGVSALAMSGEVMAYGIFPMTLNAGCEMRDAGCAGPEMSACQSNRSASPSISVTCPGSRISHPASRIPTTSRRSLSMAIT